ncbi:hypothetical protein WG66_009015 [Moniliophthora roreri]|nr:hypothetical protein WG66_009015 [Moniliophthora roreri]
MAEEPWALVHYMEALRVVVVEKSNSYGTELHGRSDTLRVFGELYKMDAGGLILTLRVVAIWHRNRKIAISLIVISIGLLLVAVVAVARVRIEKNPFGDALHVAYGVCPPVFASSHVLSVAIMALVAYETVLLVLTLIKAVEHWRELGSSSFLKVFFADASSTASIIIRYRAPSDYINLLATLQPVLHSILTGRMMLHLRRDAVLAGHLDTLQTGTYLFTSTPQTGILSIQTSGANSMNPIDFDEMGAFTDVGLMDSQTRARSWFGER